VWKLLETYSIIWIPLQIIGWRVHLSQKKSVFILEKLDDQDDGWIMPGLSVFPKKWDQVYSKYWKYFHGWEWVQSIGPLAFPHSRPLLRNTVKQGAECETLLFGSWIVDKSEIVRNGPIV